MGYKREQPFKKLKNFDLDTTVYTSTTSSPHTFYSKVYDFSDIEIGDEVMFEVMFDFAASNAAQIRLYIAGTTILDTGSYTMGTGALLKGKITRVTDTKCNLIATIDVSDSGGTIPLVQSLDLEDVSKYLSSSVGFSVDCIATVGVGDVELINTRIDKYKLQ